MSARPAPKANKSPFSLAADRYLEQGLSVMPCGPGTKFPGIYSAADGWRTAWDWQKYCDRKPTHFETSIWEKWPDAGICLALGASSVPGNLADLQLVAIDIDTEEPAEVAAIRSALPGSPVRKRGAKGETEFYLAPKSVPNRPYNNTIGGGKRRMLDLLGHGRQTVMPPSIHPDCPHCGARGKVAGADMSCGECGATGQAYRWTTLDTLETFDVADLPVLPADIADRLSTALAVFGHVDAPTVGEAGSAALDGELTVHRALNEAALANLAAWVPALQLYKCRAVGGKYKAVAGWRPSSSGRPLSKRATNLAIGPEGIKDCGEGRGYTPIDLVMAACGADLDSAFRWLQDRVSPQKPVILSARVVLDEDEPFVRTSPPGNLRGLRLAAVDGERVEVVAEAGLDLSRPDAWRDPARMPAHLRPIEPTPFILRDPTTLPRRDWLYGRHLIRGEVSLTLAPGGVGKTSLACAEAASLVSGKRLLHDTPPSRLRVWLWNGEEPEDELQRRFAAVALHYRLGADDFGDRLFVDTGNELPLVLAEQSREGIRVQFPVVKNLVAALKQRQIDLMLVDPFVSTHSVNENDNSAIQRAASAWKEVAHKAGVAIGLAHHVRKLAGRDATAEDSRGGDALVSKARDARTLNPMNSDDASRLGVSNTERPSYFSTGVGGKANMAPKGDRKVWFKMASVGLGNGQGLNKPQDDVAVVTPWTPPSIAEAIDAERVMRLAAIMSAKQWRGAPQSSSRPDWIGCAVAEAFDIELEEGFQARVKPLIAELVRAGVLVKNTTMGRHRESISVMECGNLSRWEVG